jgi:hypothetical protein
MRREFMLDDEQLQFVHEICAFREGESAADAERPDSPLSERVNKAWALLAEHMGFQQETVEAMPGQEERYFTAEDA